MFRLTNFFVGVVLVGWAFTASAQQSKYAGVGRPATLAEIKAWDIDVRRDFKGLPAGSGSVDKGQQVWDAKCASCHGTFGESNEVFAPIVGGTTKDDIKAGNVAALKKSTEGRTTLMKLSSVATLWDYINRAMPWNAPKSLTVEEVYAVTAYVLNLGEILPADFTLSDQNITQVQQLLPNRNGLTRAHGLWDVKGKPDVMNVACMKDCPTESHLGASIPEHARNAHGNLLAQNRIVGPVRGVDTTKPPPVGKPGEMRESLTVAAIATVVKAEPSPAAGGATSGPDGWALAKQYGCVACHAMEQKTVGPSIRDISSKYRGQPNANQKIVAKIKAGGSGVWGNVPMPPQAHVSEADIKTMVQWMMSRQK